MKILNTLLISSLILFMSGNSAAAGGDDEAAIKQTLARIIPGEAPDSIAETPVPGLYEVTYGSEILYITRDGRYLIQGDLVDLKERVNLTEEKRSEGRKAVFGAIDPETTVNFKPEKTRYVVYVFTDVDCPYCRKMHNRIADYEKLGMEIRYLAYPRSGLNTESYYKMLAVWCADDRQAAMTRAKSGARMKRVSCENPIEDHMAKASLVGLTGTPTLLLSDGTVIPGYVPPDQLIRILDERIAGIPSGLPMLVPLTDTPDH